jgi:uracil-DNA glycosylase family 4
MEKIAALHDLEQEMQDDKDLPLTTHLVFGEGSVDAAVMFIGEAPGETEDRLQRPFVGRGGQLLRENLQAIGWKEDEVYITNIVKRRPPENRDPSPEEIVAYRPYLTRQIQIIGSPIIVTLGRFAMNYFLPQAKISKDQGKIFKVGGRCIVPIFHPAAALRSPETMHAFRSTFEKLPRIVEKCKQVLRAASPVAQNKTPPTPATLF